MRRKQRAGSIYRERGAIVLRLTVDGPDGPRRVRHGTYPDTPDGWEQADRDRGILAAYLETWIDSLVYDVATGNLRPGTAHHYAVDLRAKVIPRIGQVALTDVTPKMLRPPLR